ncbi:uncharacterized protein LOC105700936 [Orussus abietinus]|uniref:uncharacterized protein LOC105700936 n=1 Tax=Orussus abietinus TaxID=222816 RepID=UPI00062686F4|nr:uncharacterized protein LOC105700936 [Orussus abietinus]
MKGTSAVFVVLTTCSLTSALLGPLASSFGSSCNAIRECDLSNCNEGKVCMPTGLGYIQIGSVDCSETPKTPYCDRNTGLCTATPSPDCAPPGERFVCPRQSGIYPDPLSCSRYHICINGDDTAINCPKNNIYDHEIKECRLRRVAKDCVAFDCTKKENQDVVYPKDPRIWGICVGGRAYILGRCRDYEVYDTQKRTCVRHCDKVGNQPHDDCRKYVRCYEYSPGKYESIVYPCPRGLGFDQSVGRCTRNAPCLEGQGQGSGNGQGQGSNGNGQGQGSNGNGQGQGSNGNGQGSSGQGQGSNGNGQGQGADANDQGSGDHGQGSHANGQNGAGNGISSQGSSGNGQPGTGTGGNGQSNGANGQGSSGNGENVAGDDQENSEDDDDDQASAGHGNQGNNGEDDNSDAPNGGPRSLDIIGPGKAIAEVIGQLVGGDDSKVPDDIDLSKLFAFLTSAVNTGIGGDEESDVSTFDDDDGTLEDENDDETSNDPKNDTLQDSPSATTRIINNSGNRDRGNSVSDGNGTVNGNLVKGNDNGSNDDSGNALKKPKDVLRRIINHVGSRNDDVANGDDPVEGNPISDNDIDSEDSGNVSVKRRRSIPPRLISNNDASRSISEVLQQILGNVLPGNSDASQSFPSEATPSETAESSNEISNLHDVGTLLHLEAQMIKKLNEMGFPSAGIWVQTGIQAINNELKYYISDGTINKEVISNLVQLALNKIDLRSLSGNITNFVLAIIRNVLTIINDTLADVNDRFSQLLKIDTTVFGTAENILKASLKRLAQTEYDLINDATSNDVGERKKATESLDKLLNAEQRIVSNFSIVVLDCLSRLLDRGAEVVRLLSNKGVIPDNGLDNYLSLEARVIKYTGAVARSKLKNVLLTQQKIVAKLSTGNAVAANAAGASLRRLLQSKIKIVEDQLNVAEARAKRLLQTGQRTIYSYISNTTGLLNLNPGNGSVIAINYLPSFLKIVDESSNDAVAEPQRGHRIRRNSEIDISLVQQLIQNLGSNITSDLQITVSGLAELLEYARNIVLDIIGNIPKVISVGISTLKNLLDAIKLSIENVGNNGLGRSGLSDLLLGQVETVGRLIDSAQSSLVSNMQDVRPVLDVIIGGHGIADLCQNIDQSLESLKGAIKEHVSNIPIAELLSNLHPGNLLQLKMKIVEQLGFIASLLQNGSLLELLSNNQQLAPRIINTSGSNNAENKIANDDDDVQGNLVNGNDNGENVDSGNISHKRARSSLDRIINNTGSNNSNNEVHNGADKVAGNLVNGNGNGKNDESGNVARRLLAEVPSVSLFIINNSGSNNLDSKLYNDNVDGNIRNGNDFGNNVNPGNVINSESETSATDAEESESSNESDSSEDSVAGETDDLQSESEEKSEESEDEEKSREIARNTPRGSNLQERAKAAKPVINKFKKLLSIID